MIDHPSKKIKRKKETIETQNKESPHPKNIHAKVPMSKGIVVSSLGRNVRCLIQPDTLAASSIKWKFQH